MRCLTVLLPLLLAVTLGHKVGHKGNHEDRIINGWQAADGKYSYYAFIYLNQNPYCGGTIIKENMVLTAASTMVGIYPSNLKIYPGMMTLNDAYSITPYSANKVVCHPSYQSGKSDYDVAVVYLTSYMTFSSRVSKIPLSTIEYPINSVVTLCGFGLASCAQKQYDPTYNVYKCSGQASQYLRVGYMNVNQYSGNTMVTSSAYSGVVPCYGDFGGPVVYDNMLVGVQSLVQNADCTGYSYQTSVPKVYSWISGCM